MEEQEQETNRLEEDGRPLPPSGKTGEWVSHKRVKRIIYGVTIVGVVMIVAFSIYGFASGIFLSQKALEEFISKAGFVAPVAFIFIQIVQVVFPIIPGGASCLVGVLLFGPWWGFLYNYVGICAGSIINFFLGRFYGKPFIQSVTKPETYDKYIGKIDKGRRFDIFFLVTILLPGFPDDLICMLAGLTKMTVRRYLFLLLVGKPFSIALYSIAWATAADALLSYLM